jgi:hypothetical protein
MSSLPLSPRETIKEYYDISRPELHQTSLLPVAVPHRAPPNRRRYIVNEVARRNGLSLATSVFLRSFHPGEAWSAAMARSGCGPPVQYQHCH